MDETNQPETPARRPAAMAPELDRGRAFGAARVLRRLSDPRLAKKLKDRRNKP